MQKVMGLQGNLSRYPNCCQLDGCIASWIPYILWGTDSLKPTQLDLYLQTQDFLFHASHFKEDAHWGKQLNLVAVFEYLDTSGILGVWFGDKGCAIWGGFWASCGWLCLHVFFCWQWLPPTYANTRNPRSMFHHPASNFIKSI